ncbi:MerR family transcriptional regulator [Qipengyuania flava]|uniref:MerR family transcriptional regulator n=1 Tax=Qipengyuania flava TaxID=192812 RepID=UPI00273DDF4F|nr:helix-turn-helix domain-containing protein [Qipengyuania flava]
MIKRGELAKASACNIETIRYYEDIGLLHPPERTAAGHRVYSQDDQARLGFILRARNLGFSIDELRELLGLVDSGDLACSEVHALTVAQLRNVESKIRDLRQLRQTLADMAAKCEGGSVPKCPVIDTLFGE